MFTFNTRPFSLHFPSTSLHFTPDTSRFLLHHLLFLFSHPHLVPPQTRPILSSTRPSSSSLSFLPRSFVHRRLRRRRRPHRSQRYLDLRYGHSLLDRDHFAASEGRERRGRRRRGLATRSCSRSKRISQRTRRRWQAGHLWWRERSEDFRLGGGPGS